MGNTPDLDHIDVRYVADLARVALTDDEAERYQQELDKILGYIAQLEELDVDHIEPTAHAMPLSNVMREDVAGVSLDRETVLANAPAVAGEDSIRVPAVIEEEGLS